MIKDKKSVDWRVMFWSKEKGCIITLFGCLFNPPSCFKYLLRIKLITILFFLLIILSCRNYQWKYSLVIDLDSQVIILVFIITYNWVSSFFFLFFSFIIKIMRLVTTLGSLLCCWLFMFLNNFINSDKTKIMMIATLPFCWVKL